MKSCLVLGAGGALGLGLCKHLYSRGLKVKALSLQWDEKRRSLVSTIPGIEIIEGSIFSEDVLIKALKDVTHVFYFVSFSVPGTSPAFASIEVRQTLQGLNTVLEAMVKTGVRNIIYPSSGGTIYGDTAGIPAREDFPLRPMCSYGAGKVLSEDLIRFYSRVHKISHKILRISNIYGYPIARDIPQGVIDVFLKKIRDGGPLEIWGPLDIVRDYLYIEDLFGAIDALLNISEDQNLTVNVGTGRGVTLECILQALIRVTQVKPIISSKPSSYSGIPYNVLNCSFLKGITGWVPKYSLDAGLEKIWDNNAKDSRLFESQT